MRVEPRQIDALFSDYDGNETPGCALAILQDGQIRYARGYGMADLSHDVPITTTTPFHVASLSKQFTVLAVLLLEEDGLLSLEDDIRKYLPELQDLGAIVSIRHILQNTSGLQDQWDLLNFSGNRYSLDLVTDVDVMALLRRQRCLNFPPGSQYLYSNSGFTLAAQIVERISGKTLRDFTTRRIFQPLGMTQTHFRDDHAEINKGEALGYQRTPEGRYRLSVTNFDHVGPTSLYTTVEDLAKWDANFYAPSVGSPALFERMMQRPRLPSGMDSWYAMALMMLSYRGLPVVEHTGSDAGYRADMLRFPEQHFSVFCLFNTIAPAAAFSRRIADLYLADIFPAPPRARFGRCDCTSFNATPFTLHRFQAQATGMVLELRGQKSSPGLNLQVLDESGVWTALMTDGQGRFLLPGSIDPLSIESGWDEPQRLVIRGEGKPDDVWDRLPEFALSAPVLERFAGRYWSEELDTSYAIEVRGDRLILTRSKFASEPLTPIAEGAFKSSLGVHRFLMRVEDGRASSMRLSTQWSHNIHFTLLQRDN